MLALSLKKTVTEERDLSYEFVKGSDKYVVYTDKRVIHSTEYEDDEPVEKIIKGITSIENIKSITGFESVSNIISQPDMYEGKAVVACIYNTDLELVRLGKLHISEAVQTDNILDRTDVIYILWNNGSYLAKRLDETWLPLPIRLSYMTSLNDRYYDLDKCLKHIKQLRKEEKGIIIPDGVDRLEITDIPYYNCSEGKERQIEFLYLPTQEEYNILVTKKTSFDREIYVLDTILELEKYKLG